MNNQRRNELKKAGEALDTVLADIQILHDEEEKAFENLPEGLQQAEKGEVMQAAMDAMEKVMSAIEEAQVGIENAQE